MPAAKDGFCAVESCEKWRRGQVRFEFDKKRIEVGGPIGWVDGCVFRAGLQ